MAASCLQFAHIINIAYHVIPRSDLGYTIHDKNMSNNSISMMNFMAILMSKRKRKKEQLLQSKLYQSFDEPQISHFADSNTCEKSVPIYRINFEKCDICACAMSIIALKEV